MQNTIAADLVETLLLTTTDRALGLQQIASLQSKLGPLAEFMIGSALRTMKRRATVLGPDYPFEILPHAVRKSSMCEATPYVRLLTLSPNGLFRETMDVRALDRAAVDFERITEIALHGLAGPGTSAIRFGWPSDVGRPMEFPNAIVWLGEKIGIPLGTGFRPPRRKDGGVDIVAWRRFADQKSAFPIYLVQCTIQGNLQNKANDIDLRNWSYWLDFSRDPMPILAVPQDLPFNEDWKEVALKCLILDRLRIIELLKITQNSVEQFDNSDAIKRVRKALENQ